MNGYFLKLCWKNLWRNKRRALLTLNAIAFGVMVLVSVYNYYDAFHEQIIHNAIRYHSGHILITAPDYFKNKAPNLRMDDASQIEKWVKKQPELKAYTSRVVLQGLISSPYGSANLVFQGIDPKKEKKVTRFASNIIQGTFFENKKAHPIVLGKVTADQLKVKPGSKVVALTQGIDGSVGNELFIVSGIFETQSDLDRSLAFISLADARALLSLGPKAIHQFSMVLKQEDQIPAVQARLTASFGEQIEIRSWQEVQKHIMALIELNKTANRILMAVVLFVASLGIANAILMGILERTREFGVMSAIGTDRREMVRMVITETLLLSTAGTILGTIFGILITLYFGEVGFDLKWLTSQPIIVNGAVIQTVSYPVVNWMNVGVIALVVILLSFLASLIPVRHVSRLKTVDALRSI